MDDKRKGSLTKNKDWLNTSDTWQQGSYNPQEGVFTEYSGLYGSSAPRNTVVLPTRLAMHYRENKMSYEKHNSQERNVITSIKKTMIERIERSSLYKAGIIPAMRATIPRSHRYLFKDDHSNRKSDQERAKSDREFERQRSPAPWTHIDYPWRDDSDSFDPGYDDSMWPDENYEFTCRHRETIGDCSKSNQKNNLSKVGYEFQTGRTKVRDKMDSSNQYDNNKSSGSNGKIENELYNTVNSRKPESESKSVPRKTVEDLKNALQSYQNEIKSQKRETATIEANHGYSKPELGNNKMDTKEAANSGGRFAIKNEDDGYEEVDDGSRYGSVSYFHKLKDAHVDDRRMISKAGTKLKTWQSKSKMQLIDPTNQKSFNTSNPEMRRLRSAVCSAKAKIDTGRSLRQPDELPQWIRSKYEDSNKVNKQVKHPSDDLNKSNRDDSTKRGRAKSANIVTKKESS